MPAAKINPKQAWLEQGLKILEEKGPQALSIDNLAHGAGKTKGSFYHHFKNREKYVQALLAHYERKVFGGVADEVQKEAGKKARLKRLEDLAFSISSNLELAVRSWALYDPAVREFQDRIDRQRMDHLTLLYEKPGCDARAANARACRSYAIFIGLQQLRHHFSESEFKVLLRSMYSD